MFRPMLFTDLKEFLEEFSCDLFAGATVGVVRCRCNGFAIALVFPRHAESIRRSSPVF